MKIRNTYTGWIRWIGVLSIAGWLLTGVIAAGGDGDGKAVPPSSAAPAGEATAAPSPDPPLVPDPEPLEPVNPAEAAATKRPVRIPRAASSIQLDGVLDEPAWRWARVMELEYEVRPGENTPPPARTEVLITYDDRNVYFGFRAYDPDPKAIRAHLADRDNFGSDDWIGVILDTFNDERRDFALLVNPMGVQMDFIETANSNSSTEWDAIWSSAAQITDWGWSAEIRVPFSSLRFQRSARSQVWGFDAVRGYPRDQNRQFGLFPRDPNNNCYLCQAVKIEGFDGASPGRNLEVVPTVTGTRTDARQDFPAGDLAKQDQKLDFGVTARWGITPNMILSGTINPDFSQVEADALQLDVNEPFALWYPEKRPFFMEGSDFFNTPLQAVYTRTLRDPAWGLKLTGKEGSHTVGAYVVQDNITNLIFPGNQGSDGTSLAMHSLATALRYKYDVGSNYTFGTLLTDREGDEYFNRVFGVDGNLRFTGRDSLTVQWLASRTRYPGQIVEDYDQPAGNFGSWAMDATYIHATRNLNLWGEFAQVGTDFRADLGFMPRAGTRGWAGGMEYYWLPGQNDWWSRFYIHSWVVQHNDPDGGDLLDRSGVISFNYEGQPRQSHAFIQLTRKREVYEGVPFNLTQIQLHQCMKPTGNIYVYFNLNLGDRVDYANVRAGRRLGINPGTTYNIGRHLKLDLSYTFERLTESEGRLYTAKLTQATVSYQFNDRALIRWTGQYTNYDYNAALYMNPPDPPLYNHLFNQLLFSYKINPQTVFFLGYADNFQNDYVSPQDNRLLQSDRTFFMKLGYAFTF
jgi:hypothetical protein